MNYQTAEQLTAMKLKAMRLEYARQDEFPATQALSFDDKLGMIVTAQYNARNKAKTNRLIRLAHLRGLLHVLRTWIMSLYESSRKQMLQDYQIANGSQAATTSSSQVRLV